MSRIRYQIWAGGKHAPHQDVATLFYLRVMELYLKPQGRIGMVLPHSVLRMELHGKWRSGYYERKKARSEPPMAFSADFSVKAPWDLDSLDPNDFFPMPASVIFAQFNGEWGDIAQHSELAQPLTPGPVELWRGPTGTPQVMRESVALLHDDGTFKSPYHAYASNGPTIVDRRLFFVTTSPNDNPLAMPGTIKTSPRENTQDKKKYNVEELKDMVIDEDNLFNVYMGKHLVPYATLVPSNAVLPASKKCMTLSVSEDRERRNEVVLDTLPSSLQSRWRIMERLWEANRGQNDTKSLMQNLNHLNKLSRQLEYLRNPGDRSVRIAYTTSGQPTAALITDRKAILDMKLYQVKCRSDEEAFYLLAIINSTAIRDIVEPFASGGLFGSIRDVNKHLWKLPIPLYYGGNAAHGSLAAMGGVAAVEVKKVINKEAPERRSVARLRRILRQKWQRQSPTAQSIEEGVKALLYK